MKRPRDGPEQSGWWFGSELGGMEVPSDDI